MGNLDPGPSEKWLKVAQNIEKALGGQLLIEPDPVVEQIVEKVKAKQEAANSEGHDSRWQTVDTETFSTEEAREAGPVHVGHQMWEKLHLTETLKEAGLSERACQLTEVMTINRLVEPSSELATVEWLKRTALSDILGEGIVLESPRALYRNMDLLHPARVKIETSLAERERTLFSLDDTILLYDLTSTYFEGQSLRNDKAQHGYSRDNRPDCKQVVIGLVVNGEGFPKGHEVFDGNTSDTTTVEPMLDSLDARSGGLSSERMVIVDRGMSSRENLASIRARGYHYMVAMRQSDRDEFLADLEDREGWLTFEKIRRGKYLETVLNRISLKKASAEAISAAKEKKLRSAQQKFERAKKSAESAQDAGEDEMKTLEKSIKAVESSRELKLAEEELTREETLIICVSQGRAQKDRAIREKQEKKLLVDLDSLQQRADAGKLKPNKVHENIGRLKERYPRVFRYYNVTFDEITNKISYAENSEKKELAKELDGSYIIRTDRNDLSDKEIWQAYMLLTRVEAAFRDMKSPLGERPVYHQIERRVETHIFICVLAYHLLVAIEKMLKDSGCHDSWETVRKTLRTHQVITTAFPTKSGQTLKIRKGTTPESAHNAIYDMLQIPATVMPQRRWWVPVGAPHATTVTSS
ncbi:MAG: IS1634 family transposase [Cyanobacteria bacterium]|nr:IS1634 family transposase [Cyanobacteriota bacterium]